MTRTATNGHDGTPVRQKSTLYCWNCDHESPTDGDWTRRTQGSTVAYDCSSCGTTIAKRPRPSEIKPTHVGHRTAWGRLVHSSIDVWRASLDASLTGVTALRARLR